MQMLIDFCNALVFPILFGTKVGIFILIVYIVLWIIAIRFHFADAEARAYAMEYGETGEQRLARRAQFGIGGIIWLICYSPFLLALAWLLFYYGCAFCFWLVS